ncbi:MAG TPA: S8 family serine peptidase [Streptosporangiaceae bacterium]
MLTLAGRPAAHRRGRAATCRRAAALATATALLGAPALLGAAPARADSVRSAEAWVLSAVNALPAWGETRGARVTVAVIDSGVDGNIPDLQGAVRSGPDLTGVGTPSTDSNWGVHGTWMASLIAGHGHGAGDEDGISGVAPDARILSIRVITDKADPGYAAYQRQSLRRGQRELARAVRYAVRHGAGVISMSLGYGAPSRPVRSALQYAYSRNVVIVASSGNSGDAAEASGRGSAPYSFPADYPGVLGVAAVGQDFQPASFSSDNLSVQVAAPGVNVPAAGRNGQYWLVSGTSPACALTAGVAALVRSRFPRLPGADVVDAITRSAWHRPPGGYDRQVGFGTVNAAAALVTAGQLQAAGPGRHAVAAASHFGGGPAAIPAPPVQPRGVTALVLYGLLAALCLAVMAFCVRRLVAVRDTAARAGDPDDGYGGGDAGAGQEPVPPGWGVVSFADSGNGAGPDHGAPAPGQPGTSAGRCPEHDEESRGPGPPASFSARLPWSGPQAGRHVAPSDRGPGGQA